MKRRSFKIVVVVAALATIGGLYAFMGSRSHCCEGTAQHCSAPADADSGAAAELGE